TDGSGPGCFDLAGELPVHGVARWTGSDWADMSGGISTLDAGFTSLCTWDDGTGPALYAGNLRPSGAQNRSPVFVAKWSGTEWSPLTQGSGFAPSSSSLYVQIDHLAADGAGAGSSLYACGAFASTDGVSSSNFA